MKIHDSLGLGDHPSTAPLYAAYGSALVESARANTDVFGAKAAPVAVTALGPTHASTSAGAGKASSSSQHQQKRQKTEADAEAGKDEEGQLDLSPKIHF